MKGEGFYHFRDRVYPVNPGQIFTIFPEDVVTYETKPEKPWTFCWFGFSGSRAAELLGKAGITPAGPVASILPDTGIPQLVNHMLDLLESDRKVYSTKILGYLYLILSELEDSYNKSGSQSVKRDYSAEYVEHALRLIECNYFKPLTIQSVADFIGLERSYFTKLFHKHTGTPPQYYLMKFRIDKAIGLMTTTSLSLKEISKCVGIEEGYYFSRLFKKITGQSPSRFRTCINNPEKEYL